MQVAQFDVQDPLRVALEQQVLTKDRKYIWHPGQNLGLNNVTDVRIGKHIDLQIEADTKEAAMATAEDAAKKLLANPVMEVYEITVS